MTGGALRRLGRDVAIYGAGDVAISAVSFLLIPIYTRVLTPGDYGVFALLLTIEAGSKIVLRWGLDAAFMRLYYDCADRDDQRTLASTIWLFLAAINLPMLALGLIAAAPISSAMFGTDAHAAVLRVFFVNTFAIGFFFIPFNLYRVEGKSSQFAALTFLRAAGTTALRLALVVGAGMGVFGLVLADLLLTAIVAMFLFPTLADLLRPRFSTLMLKEALGFGLPRVPHGLAHQVTAVSDRWVLNMFLPADRVGVYSIGATFGLGIKLFLSAFEYAWAPFVFAAMDRPAAKDLYRRVTTYVTALLVLLVAGLSAISDELVRLMTPPAFHDAAIVVPWVAIGVALQGFFQLTAVGLNITKRTALLPIATFAAALTSIGANLILVPRFGIVGAAWTAVLSYGTLAAVGFTLSQRVYPIRYEWGRLLSVVLAGAGSYVLASSIVDGTWTITVRLTLRSLAVTTSYLALLVAARVIQPAELAALWRARRQLPPPEPSPSAGEVTEMAGEIATVSSLADAAPGPRDHRKLE